MALLAYLPMSWSDDEQKASIEAIFNAVGISCWVDDEAKIDAVTAVSGSGPAYFFLMMEAMQKVGQELGLSEQVARDLTIQTALGAAQMASTSEHNATDLRLQVSSPGGTTRAAIANSNRWMWKILFVRRWRQHAIALGRWPQSLANKELRK